MQPLRTQIFAKSAWKLCLSAMGQSLPGGEVGVAHSAGIEYSFAGPTRQPFNNEGIYHSVYDSWKYCLGLQSVWFFHQYFSKFAF